MKKKVLISSDRRETRVAILEAGGSPAAAGTEKSRAAAKPGGPDAADWRIAELYVERRGGRSIVGNVYKARVDNVVPGLEAAFVDIGHEKNGFLHVDDIVIGGKEVGRRGQGGKPISELLKAGQEIVVQITKDPLKTKGARLTMQLSIPGRYMVYVPQGEGIGFSRRLDDKERERLRKETKGVDLISGGAIVRTAARGAKKADFEREMLYLHMLHEVLQKRVKETPAPALVFQEADLSVRVLRDVFSDEFEGALVESDQQIARVESFLIRTAPDLVDRVDSYTEPEPLFEAYGIDQEIEKMLSRRVDLPSGGYLIIDHTEALTVIDVNSGSFTGGRGKNRSLEETITKTNLEAADEAVRQIRLRDIGGIIVIDFIDMARASNRNAVLKTMRKALDEDRTKTHVVEISPLGLVEMTRQNVTDGVREILTKQCPTCSGDSVVLSEETVSIRVERMLKEYVAEHPKPEAYLVQVNPRVAHALIHGIGDPLAELEAETGKALHFEGGEGLPLEHFAVTFEGKRKQVEERALPFQIGDEVMVHIVEPHMYEDNVGVAKLDGYVVSVENGIEAIGAKCLVRIDHVGRNSARATMIGKPVKSSSGSAKSGAAAKTAAKSGTKASGKASTATATKPKAAKSAAGAKAKAAKADPDADGNETDADEETDSDQVESGATRTPRRRGSRGGRGRSRASAQKSDS